MGNARPCRSHARPDGAHDRRARGARASAERKSGAPDRARNPKKSRGLLREAPGIKFAWVAAEKAVFRVSELCHALGVTRSGFYAWARRPESAHARRDRQLKVLVRTSFEASKGRYGS